MTERSAANPLGACVVKENTVDHGLMPAAFFALTRQNTIALFPSRPTCREVVVRVESSKMGGEKFDWLEI